MDLSVSPGSPGMLSPRVPSLATWRGVLRPRLLAALVLTPGRDLPLLP